MPVFGSGYEVVTSTTRPSSPTAGQVIFETNTASYRWYNGSAWESFIPVGTVKAFAGAVAPTGWLLCSGTAGTAVTSSSYADLFNTLTSNGTTYPFGGSGSTTYTPDLRGRGVHGKDNMGGSAVNLITNAGSGVTGTTLGAVGGSQYLAAHTHSTSGGGSTGNDSPDHGHYWELGSSGGGQDTIDYPHRGFYGWDGNFATYGATGFGYGAGAQRHVHSFSMSGNTVDHDQTKGYSQNMPPTIIMNYIIKY